MAVALALPQAGAFEGDRVQLRASSTITYDDNLFKIAPNVTPQQVGATSRSDRIWSNLLGLRLDLPYSRQRFILDASVSDNRFAKANLLNNTGDSLLGEWDWGYMNAWTGTVQATQNRSLASFLYLQSNLRNIISQRGLSASADYALDARVKLQSAVGVASYTNSADIRKPNDYYQHYLQLGAAYVTPPGNSIGGRLRVEKDSLPNYAPSLSLLEDNSFRDTTLESYFDWRLNGVSKFSGHAGLTHRDYNQVSSRNFTGPTGRVQYDWTPNDLASVAAGIERTLYGTMDLASQFVVSQGLDVRAQWIPTPKIAATASLTYSKADFGGDAVTLAFQGGVQRHDTNRGFGLGVNYEMQRWAKLGLNYQFSDRSSNLSNIDFTDHTVMLNLLLSF